ncbi:DUF2726 domain-containing protein [Parathalassolituus penaei]|uniref:DUF2726 domain-containing protein n=1 Tax=Parathalassolituus penaei TaxID=2997323 RepID=A0A9X3EGN3_9GAMM|nr:DUF2726 domain-containing protein [Parathalassolituus penaei]MCY0966385.1 DUF2726 domain-containing protein [Parathalassolituus penaei]
MDVLEILVLLIALVLIALVVSVVLVIVQAVVGKRSASKSGNVSSAMASIPVSERVDPVVTESAATTKVNSSDNSNDKLADVSAISGDNSPTDQQNGDASQLAFEHQVIAEENKSSSIPEDEIRRPAVDASAQIATSAAGERYPYMAGGPLLSPIERLFYGDLKASVSDRTEIFCKVRASDVINPKASLSFEEMQFASEQLATQRFDFVLCDSRDFSVVCVIELDGLGEREGLRKIQREILRKCAESANLPILLVDMKRGYTIKEIRDRVTYLLPGQADGYIDDARSGAIPAGSSIAELVIEADDEQESNVVNEDHNAEVVATASAVSESAAAHASSTASFSETAADHAHQTLCPRCQSPLKMTLATTGEFAGRYFWICSQLPQCPYVAPISPPQ